MGYSLPAAIGAQIANPEKEVYCFIGDGGLQMNIQELQTIDNYNLPIKIIILNNFGYGIIKQFQDSYFGSRYHATGKGYSAPNFEKIAQAYNFKYNSIKSMKELNGLAFAKEKTIIDVHLPPGALITPKTEKILNLLIGEEFKAMQAYEAIANWCQNNGFLRAYDFFSDESKDEKTMRVMVSPINVSYVK
jgi:acetolactate synthase-1/2/3 large subunit